MMMIAFITINSGLVPLIEGLCAQIYYWRSLMIFLLGFQQITLSLSLYLRFEIIGGLRSHILLVFFERKNMFKKKQSVQDLISPLSIYIHMCTLHTYTNICMLKLSPSGFFGPSRCFTESRSDSWAHIRVPHLCSVYVCVHIQTHTTTYTPTRVKNREDTDNPPIFTSVKNSSPSQVTTAFTDQLNPPILIPQC